MNIGLVGCGNISGIYLKNLSAVFSNTVIYACCDLDKEKAGTACEQFGIEHLMTFDEMLRCNEIDMILNLTTPQTHYTLCKQALLAGKHVYVEKPLSLTYAQGKELVALAQEKNLYIGCAPDTFLGAGIQTCIKVIKEGKIGKPIAGTAFMMCHGHESWHPSPEFYYDIGGGPLFDMGPYYITALVRMLGKAQSVFAYGTRAYKERLITSKPKFGQKIPVKVDTHNAGLIQFENGAVVTLITSFDVWKHSMPNIEIYGTQGSLKVPDPNCFDGSVFLATADSKEYAEIPLATPYQENARGIGVAETALAEEEKRMNNASGALALHVLEIMEGFIKSAKEGKKILLESSPSDSVELDWDAPVGYLKTKK